MIPIYILSYVILQALPIFTQTIPIAILEMLQVGDTLFQVIILMHIPIQVSIIQIREALYDHEPAYFYPQS